ncbi:hypothetical protein ACFU8Q_02565 [Streptomyces sp. NPDC057543]|uniref:hypothetical protein n=1 Tax=Streptomyces sp. NPDC057543 TaxID=3346163 RepID=UPI0036AD2D84
MFETVLDGWAMQPRTRFRRAQTIQSGIDLVRRFIDPIRCFAVFANEYPWQWQAAEVEAFIDHLRSGQRPAVVSAVRAGLRHCQPASPPRLPASGR